MASDNKYTSFINGFNCFFFTHCTNILYSNLDIISFLLNLFAVPFVYRLRGRSLVNFCLFFFFSGIKEQLWLKLTQVKNNGKWKTFLLLLQAKPQHLGQHFLFPFAFLLAASFLLLAQLDRKLQVRVEVVRYAVHFVGGANAIRCWPVAVV